jgi:Protein of unknown function (DUF3349)
MTDWVARIVDFLRAGYPAGAPAIGYSPLLALLPRRVSDDEIAEITIKLIMRGRLPVSVADVGVEITRVTDAMPSLDDMSRVQDRLVAIGWGAHDV